MATDALNVIALVSGGKDSFFSVLHCLANGHYVVALANLHPPDSSTARVPSEASTLQHGSVAGTSGSNPLDGYQDDEGEEEEEADLNSFMYQTVGHQLIPLYATATGLPLFRQPIEGTTVQHGVSYRDPHFSAPRAVDAPDSGAGPRYGVAENVAVEDETESLVPLLRAVIAAHPEANALCTGAILSTYQRTRVESVALRLGLVPLAYLWQFPALPTPTAIVEQSLPATGRGLYGGHEDAQLLRDMEAVGLDARIVKVASAGLDEGFLWENVASEKSIYRVKRALRRFGGGGRGSVLGEGGEFETLVVDGPAALFKGRIVIREETRRIVREGGGSLWLSIRDARVDMKPNLSQEQDLGSIPAVRIPEQFDLRFKSVLDALQTTGETGPIVERTTAEKPGLVNLKRDAPLSSSEQWCFVSSSLPLSIQEQTTNIVGDIRQRLEAQALSANAITNTVIVLRSMLDFPEVNILYGALFPEPNPPARVTISCGDLLPQGSGIAIYLTVRPHLTIDGRQGLHVQSRSYWAPANIGPYSQAIAFPIHDSTQTESGEWRLDAPKAVAIAGQIPLLPARMTLPPAVSPDSVALQITLALQHLWRIGIEMHTQWWSSAVAYFPRTSSPSEMRRKALLAADAWKTAHLWSPAGPANGDAEDGPDLWDRKFNPQYMSFTDDDHAESSPSLPDWEAIKGIDLDADQDEGHIPLIFAAEVEELPRAAGVEWHAHLGLLKVSPGSLIVTSSRKSLSNFVGMLELQHLIASSKDGLFIHTTAALALDSVGAFTQFAEVSEAVATQVDTAIRSMLKDEPQSEIDATRPYLQYVGADCILYSETITVEAGVDSPEAIIPCHSIWSSRGDRLQVVALFQHHFARNE
ncbi:hypothetical protein BJ170DRAFT_21402 [Xylariales sp. AK1849]|nr:hypothetical protein BJ170DRAFT_21402 [Xylariales sp. AK1849]